MVRPGGQRGLVAVLVMTVVIVLDGCGAGTDTRNSGTTLVEYHHGGWPRTDLTVINDSNRRQLRQASALVDYHKRDFAGVYVDHRSKVVVVTASEHGQILARRRFGRDPVVTIGRSGLSLDAANQLGLALHDTVPGVRDKMVMSGIDPAASALRVVLFKTPTSKDQAAIERFAAKHHLRIEIYIDLKAQRPTLD